MENDANSIDVVRYINYLVLIIYVNVKIIKRNALCGFVALSLNRRKAVYNTYLQVAVRKAQAVICIYRRITYCRNLQKRKVRCSNRKETRPIAQSRLVKSSFQWPQSKGETDSWFPLSEGLAGMILRTSKSEAHKVEGHTRLQCEVAGNSVQVDHQRSLSPQ